MGVEPKIGVQYYSTPQISSICSVRVFHEINKPSILGGKIYPPIFGSTPIYIYGICFMYLY